MQNYYVMTFFLSLTTFASLRLLSGGCINVPNAIVARLFPGVQVENRIEKFGNDHETVPGNSARWPAIAEVAVSPRVCSITKLCKGTLLK